MLNKLYQAPELLTPNKKPLYRVKQLRNTGISNSVISRWMHNGYGGYEEDIASINHGVISGGITRTIGNTGVSFNYNGTTGYLNLGSSTTYAGTTQGSIEAWINIPATFTVNHTTKKILGLGGGAHATPGLFGFEIRRRDAVFSGTTHLGVLQRSDGGGDLSGFMGGTALSANTWYHVVLTSDGTIWKIYLNGVLESLTSWIGSNNGDWFGDTTINSPLHALGAHKFNGVIEAYYSGLIRYTVVYDRALLQSEILNLYRDGYQGLEPVVNYDFIPQGAAAGGRIMSSLVSHGGLAGMGGIAGQGGGLAG